MPKRIRYKTKSERKYSGIAKIGYNPVSKNNICVKYRFNDIEKFISFVQKKFGQVYWINIFHRKGAEKNKLAFTWGKNKGLEAAR